MQDQFKLLQGLCAAPPRSPASCLHLNVWAACRFQVVIIGPRLTGTACLTLAVQLYFAVLVPVAAVVQLPFPPSSTCTNREMGRQCPWFSKRRDLLMPSFSCVPLNQSFLLYCTVQTKLPHNFHMNRHCCSHYFWFYSESVSLCFVHTARAGQRSGWSWQGFSVLLKDTWADWVIATVGLEPSYAALQP